MGDWRCGGRTADGLMKSIRLPAFVVPSFRITAIQLINLYLPCVHRWLPLLVLLPLLLLVNVAGCVECECDATSRIASQFLGMREQQKAHDATILYTITMDAGWGYRISFCKLWYPVGSLPNGWCAHTYTHKQSAVRSAVGSSRSVFISIGSINSPFCCFPFILAVNGEMAPKPPKPFTDGYGCSIQYFVCSFFLFDSTAVAIFLSFALPLPHSPLAVADATIINTFQFDSISHMQAAGRQAGTAC